MLPQFWQSKSTNWLIVFLVFVVLLLVELDADLVKHLNPLATLATTVLMKLKTKGFKSVLISFSNTISHRRPRGPAFITLGPA